MLYSKSLLTVPMAFRCLLITGLHTAVLLQWREKTFIGALILSVAFRCLLISSLHTAVLLWWREKIFIEALVLSVSAPTLRGHNHSAWFGIGAQGQKYNQLPLNWPQSHFHTPHQLVGNRFALCLIVLSLVSGSFGNRKSLLEGKGNPRPISNWRWWQGYLKAVLIKAGRNLDSRRHQEPIFSCYIIILST